MGVLNIVAHESSFLGDSSFGGWDVGDGSGLKGAAALHGAGVCRAGAGEGADAPAACAAAGGGAGRSVWSSEAASASGKVSFFAAISSS